jgi:hypothetical protein
MAFYLAPRYVACIGQDPAEVSFFRLHYRIDGSFRVRPSTRRPDSAVALLDAEMPFRRRIFNRPRNALALEALLAAAPDAFPFERDGGRYGVGLRDGETYLYALPDATLAALGEALPRLEGILVADRPLGVDAVRPAIENWLALGKVADLGAPRRQPFGRHRLGFAIALALFVLAAAGVAALALTDGWRRLPFERAIAQHTPEGAPLLARNEALARIAGTLQALDAQRLQPTAAAPRELDRLFTSIPAGLALRKIEVRPDGTLLVYGSGTGARDWLREAGFAEADITLTEVGKFTRFEATKKLSSP